MYESKCKSKPLLGVQCSRLACCAGRRGQFLPGHFLRAGDKNARNNLVSLGMKKIFQLDAPTVQMETKKSHPQAGTFGGSWTHGLTGWAVIKSS